MKKEDNSLIDIENVETTYSDKCAFFAALASFLLQFYLIRLSLASLALCATFFTFLSIVCSLFYPFGDIRRNITTTTARRL